jgi:cytochrome c peroxidase
MSWRLSHDVKKIPIQSIETAEIQEKSFIDEPIQPIPLTVKEDPKKVELGKKLFNEPKLSRDNTISCATCHLLDKAGVDNRRRSIGIDGKIGEVNTPTVFNSASNFKQFWDGRSDSLEDQINGPTHNHLEMDSNWNEIITKLRADPQYASAFTVIYPDGVTDVNIRDAIATFERTLITPNSRFDKFLMGDPDALTPFEKNGYILFKERGCVVCHQGANAGSNMFQSFGKFGNYFEDRGNIVKADFGRMNVTGKGNDRFKFKVPTLRNVALTGPYFHDGSVTTLENAVQIMAKYQLGINLEDEEVKAIVAFLKTLTGEFEGKSLGANP